MIEQLETTRLKLRRWRPEDRDPFARMNADPRVMQYFPAPLSRAESDQFAERIEKAFFDHGFGLFAVELKESAGFIGYVGVAVPSFEAHFTPCVEIGWRIAAEHWNQGFATEGAESICLCAFQFLGIEELVSFTVPANLASRRVMEKLGMTHDEADNFDHPRIPEGHPLRRHVLYRLTAERWRSTWGEMSVS